MTMEVKDDIQQGGEKPINQEEKPSIGWHNIVREQNPDVEFADDEALNKGAEDTFARLLEENQTSQQSIQKAKEVNAQLVELFEAVPEAASFLDDLMQGASVEIAIARNFDLDSIQPVEGDPDYEEWSKVTGERKAKAQERQKYAEEIDANKLESAKVFDKFIADKGLSEEEADAFLAKADNFLDEIYLGKVTYEVLETLFNGTNYQADLDKAREAGKVAGRNENIEAVKTKAKPKGDNLPKLSSSGKAEKKVQKPDYGDKLLDNYEKRKRFDG